MSLHKSFELKKILVTGAGRGIGRALAKRLHEYGAKVHAVSRTPEHLATLKEECPNISVYSVDLANWEETANLISQLEPLDGLINNAGTSFKHPFTDFSKSEAEFNRMMDINVKAPWNISQQVVKKMMEKGSGGSIVNISTIVAGNPFPMIATYCISKSALEMMTRSLSVELGPHKIRVNAVRIGLVDTELYRSARAEYMETFNTTESGFNEAFEARTPLNANGVMLPIEDVLNTVLFVLSDLAASITGQILSCDKGHSNT